MAGTSNQKSATTVIIAIIVTIVIVLALLVGTLYILYKKNRSKIEGYKSTISTAQNTVSTIRGIGNIF